MKFSTHAEHRMQQRSIPQIVVDLLIRFGRSEPAGNGAWKYFFDKPSRRRFYQYAGVLARSIEEHLDVYVVVGSDQSIITAGHRCERIRRH
jgi:hypothetical protein